MAQKVRQRWGGVSLRECSGCRLGLNTRPYNDPPYRSQVARIKEELSLETSLPIAKAIAEANAVMGIEPQGALAKQVESLLTELGIIN